MEFDNFVAEDSPGWGVTSPKSGDIVRDAIKKEKVLKYEAPLTVLVWVFIGFREIISYQEDLRGEQWRSPAISSQRLHTNSYALQGGYSPKGGGQVGLWKRNPPNVHR